MPSEPLMWVCINYYSVTRVRSCRQKSTLNPRWFMLPTVLMRWSCGFHCKYKTFHFESYLAPCPHVFFFFFSVLFSIVINSPGKETAGLYASHAFVCLSCMCNFVSFFSSSWCHGLAAACDCGTSLPFDLIF